MKYRIMHLGKIHNNPKFRKTHVKNQTECNLKIKRKWKYMIFWKNLSLKEKSWKWRVSPLTFNVYYPYVNQYKTSKGLEREQGPGTLLTIQPLWAHDIQRVRTRWQIIKVVSITRLVWGFLYLRCLGGKLNQNGFILYGGKRHPRFHPQTNRYRTWIWYRYSYQYLYDAILRFGILFPSQ